MRKSVKPIAVWPSNGAAYPSRARGYPDSVNLRSSFKRQFSTQQSGLHQPITRHGQYISVFSSRTRSLRNLDQLLIIRGGPRQLSVSTPQRSGEEDEFDGFDEEDEDDIIISSSDMSRMVRQKGKILEAKARQKREQEQALMRRREELQSRADRHVKELRDATVLLQSIKENLESIRHYAKERRRAHEKWMRRYEQVIGSSASSFNVGSQLFEEFLLIKYPKLGKVEPYINDNVAFIQHGEAEVSNCRQALRRIGLASRRIHLEMRLAQLEASLDSTLKRLGYHVTPVVSAKRKIEEILEPLIRFQSRYIQLQDLGFEIRDSTREISLALKQIAAKSHEEQARLEMFRKGIEERTPKLTQSLHEYRANERSRRWGGPLGKTHILAIIQNYYHYATIRMVASDIEMDPDLLANEINTHGISSLLVHWYLYRWKEGAPRSVDLDIAWRHFDVYYPFYMLYVSFRSITSESFRFQKIYKVMGASKSEWEAKFRKWKSKSNIMRANYLTALEASSYCTWLRLETEDKVSRLGGVPDTVAKGLFTPKDPPSSDLRRFFLCIDAICDGLSRSINLDEATAEFEKLPHPTAIDMIELLDHSPSHKRGINGLRSLTKKATTQEQPLAIEEEITEEQTMALEEETTLEQPLVSKEETTQEANAVETPVQTGFTRLRPRWTSRPKEETTQEANAIETPVQTRFTRLTPRWMPPPSRGYCTDSRAFMNDNGQQCGVSESEIALIKKDRIVELANKDAAISCVSDAEHTGIMSSHELLDDTDEPPIVASDDTKPQFWSHNQYKTPEGGKIGIHYCKNLEHAERAAALFSGSKLLGFDIEWKPQAQTTSGIKSNVSLIQIANEERIALFHIALFKGNEIQDLVPPSLKKLLESTDTVKVGVSIKADCSRVRRHLDIDTKGQFELSHLYKLVKYGSTQPKMVDRRAVNLAQQVEELLGLPLRKDSDVRKSDWTKPLDYTQVQYAASDAYACICLHRTLEAKRKALNPVPPLPAFAELNLPILLAEEDKVEIEDKVAELSVRMKESLELVDAGEEDVVEVNDENKKLDPT
ncbi:Werner syndrome ATP-dependent helicase [Talaromyces pinophilus]|nr:Werner syndrome ATP-dependent helicase [Talaromyces pinophilus]